MQMVFESTLINIGNISVLQSGACWVRLGRLGAQDTRRFLAGPRGY